MAKSKYFKLQIVALEFFISFSIFTFIVFLLYIFQIQKTKELANYFEDLTLQKDLENLKVLIDIEGKPKDWNYTYYEILGLRNEEKIDYSKILNLKNVSYDDIKKNLFLLNEFCLDFEIEKVGNCNFKNSSKIFVEKIIAPIKVNENVFLKEIKIEVWK